MIQATAIAPLSCHGPGRGTTRGAAAVTLLDGRRCFSRVEHGRALPAPGVDRIFFFRTGATIVWARILIGFGNSRHENWAGSVTTFFFGRTTCIAACFEH